MATRTYTRNPVACNGRQLTDLIRVATGLGDAVASVDTNSVAVTATSITAAHDSAIQNVINTYVYNDDYETPQHELDLRGVIATLEQWAADAQSAVAAWDGQNTAQRFAALKIVVQRFGILCSKTKAVLKVLERGD